MRLGHRELVSLKWCLSGSNGMVVGIFALLIAGCAFEARTPGYETHRVYPGTYQIEICRGACGARPSNNLLARGRLVLEASSYASSDLPRRAGAYFEEWTALLLGAVANDRPNACFVLDRLRSGEGSYAGIEKVGLTLWEPHRGDSVRVALYQSPDASYYAVVRPTGRELRGRGRSYGIGDASDDFREDSIRAVRIGAPDRGLCIRAAETEAAKHGSPAS